MSYSLSDIFFILAIFQLLFISFFLFTYEKGKRISNGLLSCFFLSICLNLIDVFLLMKRIYFANPSLAGWGNCLPLLFGPFLFLYTQSVLQKNFVLKGKKWLHFVPFILFFLGTEGYWLSRSTDFQKIILNHIIERKIPTSIYLASSLIFLQFIAYVTASLRIIKRYQLTASEKFSEYRRTNISWLYSTIIFFTVLMAVFMLNGYLGLTSFAKYYYLAFTLVILALLVFVIKVVLATMKSPDLFTVADEKPVSSSRSVPALLEEDDKQKILEMVLHHMAARRPFLEPELTLDQLASQLSIRPKILSHVINERLNQNFFDFVNRYRIEEARRLLTNPPDKKITVLEVLYEVGFNSKSSFNTLFKKHTGLTPSEFRKKNLRK